MQSEHGAMMEPEEITEDEIELDEEPDAEWHADVPMDEDAVRRATDTTVDWSKYPPRP